MEEPRLLLLFCVIYIYIYKLKLSHILFVDDAVMMGEGTWENFRRAKQILDLYKKATGMHTNIEKSILSQNAIPETVKNRLIT